MSDRDYDVVDLRPAMSAVARNWFKIGLGSIIGAGLALGYTFVIKPVWGASTVLLLPVQDATAFNPLAAFTDTTDPIEILSGIVQSRTSLDYISKQTGQTKRQIDDMMTIVSRKAQNQMEIDVSNEDKQLALKVVKLAKESLKDLSTSTDLSLGKTQAKLLSDAVVQKSKELADAEDALIKFQKGTVTVPDPLTPFTGSAYGMRLRDIDYELGKVEQQLKVARSQAAKRAQPATELPSGLPDSEKWRAALTDLEYKLRLAENQYGPKAPQVVKLKQDIEVTRDQLQKTVQNFIQSVQKSVDPLVAQYEANRLLLTWQKEYLQRMANSAPSEAVTFQRLLREVTTRSEVLKNVRARYENAKLDAEVDRVRWSTLVEPYVEEQPINKKWIRNAAIGWFLGLVIGIFVAGRKHAKTQQFTNAAVS